MREGAREQEQPSARVQVTRPLIGLAHMGVCVVRDASDEEVLEVCNRENPAGTSLGWTTVLRSGSPKAGGPVQCQGFADRLHLVVRC